MRLKYQHRSCPLCDRSVIFAAPLIPPGSYFCPICRKVWVTTGFRENRKKETKQPTQKTHAPSDPMKFLGVLFVVLCVLFYKSFIPELILFSNDNPIGVVSWLEPYEHHPLMILGDMMILVWLGLMFYILKD